MYLSNITEVHIELTDKCQAACPMCARNHSGGKTRSFIKNKEISFVNFKKWFSPSFLANLKNFYSCGNYGDPVFATDCLEIYEYVRSVNPTVRLAIHTNGSLRTPKWWKALAKVMGTNGEVIFAVDGFKGKHELYRRNTSFDKIIENIKAYVEAGGQARVDSLVFQHNQDDVEELEKFLLSIGVKSVNFKSTGRFYNLPKFEVLNKNDQKDYDLYPATRIEFYKKPKQPLEKFLEKDYLAKFINDAKISPACVNNRSVYVDPYGNLFPCCYMGSDYLEQPLEEKMVLHTLRNITVEKTKEMMCDIGVPNLNDKNIDSIISDSQLWQDIKKYWEGENKCLTCIKNCSNSIYD